MANIIISDLFLNKNFLNQLTEEELDMNIHGGVAGAASAGIAINYQQGDFIDEAAAGAAVSWISEERVKPSIKYSLDPVYVVIETSTYPIN